MAVPGASAPGGGLSSAPSPSSVPGTGESHLPGTKALCGCDRVRDLEVGGALLVIWAVTSRVFKRGKRNQTLPLWGERPGHAALQWGESGNELLPEPPGGMAGGVAGGVAWGRPNLPSEAHVRSPVRSLGGELCGFTRAGPLRSGCLCGRVRVRWPRARPGALLEAARGGGGGLDGSPAGSLTRPQPQPQVRQPRVRGAGGCHAEAPGSLREGHRESGKLRDEWTQPRPGWGSPLKPEGGVGRRLGCGGQGGTRLGGNVPDPGRSLSRQEAGRRVEAWVGASPVRGQVRRSF